MKREFLKGLGLDDEAIEKVMAEHGKSVNAEKAKVQDLTTQAEALQQQLTDRDKDLKQLQKEAGDNEELKQKYADLETKYKDDTKQLQTAIAQTKKAAAIDMALTAFKVGENEYKPKNMNIVKNLLDAEALELDDNGALKGLDDQLKGLVENEETAFLFDTKAEQKQPATPRIIVGGNPSPQTQPQTIADKIAANINK